MKINRLSAFSHQGSGGNPAGVVLLDEMPSAEEMYTVAKEVGYSETVFAIKTKQASDWRVRYFSPESEVPFCGHATIALGALLAKEFGTKKYNLELNDAHVNVEGFIDKDLYSASLTSPDTHYTLLKKDQIDTALELFSFHKAQLNERYQPAFIHGGSNHYVFILNSREDLSAMKYDFDAGKKFMNERELITVMFAVEESLTVFHVRNAFASGGVYEDPATGAAAAAFTGFLRDSLAKPSGDRTLIQGEDMGCKSVIHAKYSPSLGKAIQLSGAVHVIE